MLRVAFITFAVCIISVACHNPDVYQNYETIFESEGMEFVDYDKILYDSLTESSNNESSYDPIEQIIDDFNRERKTNHSDKKDNDEPDEASMRAEYLNFLEKIYFKIFMLLENFERVIKNATEQLKNQWVAEWLQNILKEVPISNNLTSNELTKCQALIKTNVLSEMQLDKSMKILRINEQLEYWLLTSSWLHQNLYQDFILTGKGIEELHSENINLNDAKNVFLMETVSSNLKRLSLFEDVLKNSISIIQQLRKDAFYAYFPFLENQSKSVKNIVEIVKNNDDVRNLCLL